MTGDYEFGGGGHNLVYNNEQPQCSIGLCLKGRAYGVRWYSEVRLQGGKSELNSGDEP